MIYVIEIAIYEHLPKKAEKSACEDLVAKCDSVWVLVRVSYNIKLHIQTTVMLFLMVFAHFAECSYSTVSMIYSTVYHIYNFLLIHFFYYTPVQYK